MSDYSLLFSSHDELKELTDLKIPSAQIRWLVKHSFPYKTGASGKPKVLRSYVLDKLRQYSADTAVSEPNFDAIR